MAKKATGKRIVGLSLFASAGIAEMGLKGTKVDIAIANEYLPDRVKMHSFWHKNSAVIQGDISDPKIKQEIIRKSLEKKVDFVMATPPCQGASLIGKNKKNSQMVADQRNTLIFDALEIISEVKPSWILIENVPRFFQIELERKGKKILLGDLLTSILEKDYTVVTTTYNAADYGVPQNRKRTIVRAWKKGLAWSEPKKTSSVITVRQAIAHLPTLESGERSEIKNHYARNHDPRHVKWMKFTETGQSAFKNPVHFPKNSKTGQRMKGFQATYKRINWDEPAPTITMRNDCISSQSNVHPGREVKKGVFSDARVLTLRELFILFSIDPDIDLPSWVSDIKIRNVVGEAVPPMLIKKIVDGVGYA